MKLVLVSAGEWMDGQDARPGHVAAKSISYRMSDTHRSQTWTRCHDSAPR